MTNITILLVINKMPKYQHSMSGPFLSEDPEKEDEKNLKRKK